MPIDAWFHLAVVNDGRLTTLYVDGAPVLRNPARPAGGLATTGRPWLIGAAHRAGVVEQGFHGWLGDVRFVDRPLTRAEFLS
ncbi:MAG TPA: LamG-like jellyroll fold domain-containing protein [Pilimelia sp.]|nr:LamG-like jellyroll fold domain-containing protein [Pilimelia sp.]